jgi:zinc ribbon protein
MPEPAPPHRDDPPRGDLNELAPLNYAALRPSAGRTKNFRLVGTGLNPFLVYGSALLFIGFWFFGAYLLSIFGPIFASIVTIALFATALVLSRKESLAEARTNMGLCPKCGYDLRANNERCPECGNPIPEAILRWRRLRPPVEPGMPGYVEPQPPRTPPRLPPSTTP